MSVIESNTVNIGSHIIYISVPDILIKEVTLLSYNHMYILYHVKLENNTTHISKISLINQLEKFLFFELINKSLLWNFDYIYDYLMPTIKIKINIKLNKNLISEYLGKSTALNMLVYTTFENLTTFTKFDDKKSFIPDNILYEPNILCKIKLYDYQKKTLYKMIDIENSNIINKINYIANLKLYDNNIKFDPITNIIEPIDKYLTIISKGGILADEMGLGKTITSLALILSNPNTYTEFFKYSTDEEYKKIYSKATLIVCPSHLSKQWEIEAIKLNPLFKIKSLLTKKDHEKLIYNDFIEADIIITSHQFLMNFKYYPSLHCGYSTPSSYSPILRSQKLTKYFKEEIEEKFKNDNTSIKQLPLPIFEFFYFNRLIVDEGHEIFGEMLSNQALSKYMTSWLNSIEADKYWYISGSPFVNYTGFVNTLKFLKIQIIDDTTKLLLNPYNNVKVNFNFENILKKDYICDKILKTICIRHKKSDITEQLCIKGYEEIIEWIEFTDLEKTIYNAKVNKVDDESLLKLCCHPFVLESSKRLFGNTEIDLSVMETKLIEHHTSLISTYEHKLSTLTNTNQSYHMVKKNYETIVSESKFMLEMLNKMNDTAIIEDDENTCSVCFEKENISLTKCGHVFCLDCIKNWLNMKNNCPMCKKSLTLGEIYTVNKTVIVAEDTTNPLIKKYGSKLGKIISIIRSIITNDDARIIIFSQWDSMLLLISKTLSDNGIANCSVKGNVWSKTAAINKFKNGKNLSGEENKVILLSIKNCASGTNLTEATHIFFVEPINENKEITKAIESQAIARACRIGQKHKIKLYRILIKNSIEETIYNKYINIS